MQQENPVRLWIAALGEARRREGGEANRCGNLRFAFLLRIVLSPPCARFLASSLAPIARLCRRFLSFLVGGHRAFSANIHWRVLLVRRGITREGEKFGVDVSHVCVCRGILLFVSWDSWRAAIKSSRVVYMQNGEGSRRRHWRVTAGGSNCGCGCAKGNAVLRPEVTGATADKGWILEPVVFVTR